MELLKHIKERKLELSIYLSLFMFLVVSLVFRNIKPGLYPVSIFLISLIFISSQYFDFEYRYFIGFALVLLVTCPFLLIAKYETLAEYFANYVYSFLVLGVIGYFLDSLRKKLKKKGYFKVYRVVFLSMLILLLISPLIIYREYVSKLPGSIKYANYYINKENAMINNQQMVKNIIITVESPIEDSEISGYIQISGWAIEGNSTENSGIDKVDIFIDGKPGMGIYLAENYIKDNKKATPLEEFLTRLFRECRNKVPSDKDIIFWVYKIGVGNNAINDVVKDFWSSKEFINKNLGNEEYVNILYKVILNRKPDNVGYNHWMKELDNGLDRDGLLEEFLGSIEFKNTIRDYYNVNVDDDLPEGINLLREDIGNNYGEQFRMSGFILNFDSTQFTNSKHTIYVFTHSTYFGWDYVSFDIYINN